MFRESFKLSEVLLNQIRQFDLQLRNVKKVNELSTKNNAFVQLLFAADTQPDILLGLPKSAICVQVLDDSQNSAIHMSYHILLCSSSSWELRYPMLKVV
jgi:hypothetical protein